MSTVNGFPRQPERVAVPDPDSTLLEAMKNRIRNEHDMLSRNMSDAQEKILRFLLRSFPNKIAMEYGLNPAEKIKALRVFRQAFAELFPDYEQKETPAPRPAPVAMMGAVPMTIEEMQRWIRARFTSEPECFTNPRNAPQERRDKIHDELLNILETCPISFHRQDMGTFKTVWQDMFPNATTADAEPADPSDVRQHVPVGNGSAAPHVLQKAHAATTAIMSAEEMEQRIRGEFPEGNLRIDPETREAIHDRLMQRFTSPQERELFQRTWQGLFAASAVTTTSAPPAQPARQFSSAARPTTSAPPPPPPATQTVRVPPQAVAAPPQPHTDASNLNPEFTAPAAPPYAPQVMMTETEMETKIRNRFLDRNRSLPDHFDPHSINSAEKTCVYRYFFSKFSHNVFLKELFKKVWGEKFSTRKPSKREHDAGTAPASKRVQKDSPNQGVIDESAL